MTPAVEQALHSLRAVAAESESDRAKLLRAIASTLESALAAAPAGEPADERAAFEAWRDEFVTRTGVMPNEADAWRARAALNAAAPAGEPDDFDKWQANPYTKVLQESIAEDYEPKHRDPISAPLRAANLSAALRAIVRECRGTEMPYSTDSYLPPHLMELAVAALESTETQEHETPLQVIEAMRRDEGVDDEFVANLSPRRRRILARDGDEELS